MSVSHWIVFETSFSNVLRHETLTFLELFCMYKSSLHITCLRKCLNQLFEPFFCSLHVCLKKTTIFLNQKMKKKNPKSTDSVWTFFPRVLNDCNVDDLLCSSKKISNENYAK
jgi:hypothetical protein